jgi:hypothetical protein
LNDYGRDKDVSIVRIGLGETKGFSEGYDAIFGKKKKDETKAEEQPKPAPKAKAAGKKKAKKK